MIPLSEWIWLHPWANRPWLILGKGPSFSRIAEVDRSGYYLCSLNHVVRELPVDVAHFIDLEAVEASSDGIRKNARWLMTPRFPHINFSPSTRPLEELLDQVPVLREFAERGRLVYYPHVPHRSGLESRYSPRESPLIPVHYFSAEAAVRILAAAGVRVVRTLGIDGGGLYNSRFHDLKTCLANGHSSFDRQFINIFQTAQETNMDYGPLEEPIRVYVGTDQSQMLATRVLEYSIRKYASRPVEVVPMCDLKVPIPKDPNNHPRTGFSFSRLLIPSLTGYKGKAIYLDADMLVFSDIAEIWDIPTDRSPVHCSRQDTPPLAWRDNGHFQPGRQMSVMLLDCGQLDWDINAIVKDLDNGTYDYRKLMFDLCIVPADRIGEGIPPEWNSLEHFETGKTKLLHYTDMSRQPWRRPGNPLRDVWRAYYREAVEAGAIEPSLVEEGIRAGHLLPELADDLKLAPGRMSTPEAARRGTMSEMHRRLELERVALAAEVGVLREQLKTWTELAATSSQSTEQQAHTILALRRQVEELNKQIVQLDEGNRKLIQELHQQWQVLYTTMHSLSWKIGRVITKPLRVVRNLLRGNNKQSAA